MSAGCEAARKSAFHNASMECLGCSVIPERCCLLLERSMLRRCPILRDLLICAVSNDIPIPLLLQFELLLGHIHCWVDLHALTAFMRTKA